MKILITLLIVMSVPTYLVAQNPTTIHCIKRPTGSGGNNFTYTYDFSNLHPNLDCYLTPRNKKDNIFIKIDSINRLIVDVDVKGTSISLPLTKINIFDSLLQLNTAGLSPSIKTIDGVPSATKQVVQGSGSARKFKFVPNDDPYLSSKRQIAIFQTAINTEFSTVVDNLKLIDYFIKFAKGAPEIISGECCSQALIRSRLIADPYIMQFHIGAIADFHSLQAIVNNEPTSIARSIKDAEGRIRNAKKQAEMLLAQIKRTCKENKTQDQSICDIDMLEDNFPDDLDKVLEQSSKITLDDVAKIAKELNNLLIRVDNPQNFKFLSSAIIAEGDFTNIEILMKPKEAQATQFGATSINLHIPVKGKFEWAIGPALNFHVTKSLFDRSYRIDSFYKTDGTTQKDTFNLKQNYMRNAFIPSVAIMAHFYWQRHASLTPGISLGLSTSPANLSELRAYLGASLLVGDVNNKLILSAGLAGGSVNRLRANLIEGANPKAQIPFTGEKLPAPDDLIEKAFKVGVYCGLTYKINN